MFCVKRRGFVSQVWADFFVTGRGTSRVVGFFAGAAGHMAGGNGSRSKGGAGSLVIDGRKGRLYR